MRTIIAGSRTVHDVAVVVEAMRWACVAGIRPSVILSGAARGADTLGEWWAAQRGMPVEKYPADWTAHGRSAGHLRNRHMADRAGALVALWDGQSRGTADMIKLARERELLVFVWQRRPTGWGAA
jgi:hypothetical protein